MPNPNDITESDRRALKIAFGVQAGERLYDKLVSLRAGAPRYAASDVTISSAALLTLFSVPQTLVAAPGAGKFLDFAGMTLRYTAGNTAYGTIAGGDDFAVKYTNASGEEVARVEATGFIDQGTDQVRHVQGPGAKDAVADYTPVSNAALVLHMLNSEVTDGDGTLTARVYYRVLDDLS